MNAHNEDFNPDTENYEHTTLTLSDESDILVNPCGCHGDWQKFSHTSATTMAIFMSNPEYHTSDRNC